MRDIANLIEAGTDAQIEKLEANAHKTGFSSLEIDTLFKMLECEVDELLLEVNDWKDGKDNLDKVRLEAADVANFAHMIILKCDEYGRKV